MADEDRIGRVARALCVADGNDPEEVVHLGTDEVEAGSEAYSREVFAPAWTTYASEARRLVAAMIALGVIE